MPDDAIKICSLNCQGTGNTDKRKDILNNLKIQGFSIICLQDTHFSQSNEKIIANEWGYKAVFCSNNTRSRGVAFFFKNDFELKILNTCYDRIEMEMFLLLILRTIN